METYPPGHPLHHIHTNTHTCTHHPQTIKTHSPETQVPGPGKRTCTKRNRYTTMKIIMDLNIQTPERPMLLREWGLGPGGSFSGEGVKMTLSSPDQLCLSRPVWVNPPTLLCAQASSFTPPSQAHRPGVAAWGLGLPLEQHNPPGDLRLDGSMAWSEAGPSPIHQEGLR